MATENFIFWINIAIAALLMLSMVFLSRNRNFERSVFENSINAFLFGLFLLFVARLVRVIEIAEETYPGVLSSWGVNTSSFLGDLVNISALALLPLFAICMLVSVMLAKDAFDHV
tara:strand:- start:7523 stop:7867 length:345 start_codon:yes stop_codon:yes gene_type:complete